MSPEDDCRDQVRRHAILCRRRWRKRPDRTHDRLMVVAWLLLYLPLFGTLIFMACN